MKALVDRWALVSGSSRGIGQQVAKGLAEHGCNIILHATRPENCDATLDLLRPYDINTIVVSGFLGKQLDEQEIIQSVIEQVGRVDILYNNAAVMSHWHEKICDIPMQEWNRIFDINFLAQVRLCRAFYPLMRQQKWGRIVNMVSGMQNTPQLTPYSAAKAALQKFTLELSAELNESNVLVNALDPGWLKTDMGGENADYDVETVLPGALAPALLPDYGTSGVVFRAQDLAPGSNLGQGQNVKAYCF